MDFQKQYDLVRSSRKVLLEYCQTISVEDFLTENSSFGIGSIRNLLVHIGTTYEFWIGKHALNKDIHITEYNSVKNALEAVDLFLHIDSLVEQFIKVYSEIYLTDIELNINDKKVDINPFTLFTHVITHEFHHKGQILSLSRHLGYLPIDTDVIR